jgi:hypothetical protein
MLSPVTELIETGSTKSNPSKIQTSNYLAIIIFSTPSPSTRGLSIIVYKPWPRYDKIPQANWLEAVGCWTHPRTTPIVVPACGHTYLKLLLSRSCASVSGYMSVSTDPCTHTVPRIAVSAPHILPGKPGALPRSCSKLVAPITNRVISSTR